MANTKSSLVSYTKLSPHHSGQRTHAVDRITPHCVVGQCSVEALGVQFTNNEVSSNYGIGYDGRVGLYVEENNRSWCSSSNPNDQRAITIECASDTFHPYAFKDAVYNKLIDLCTDICKRYGKKKLLWFADKDKTLAYEPKADEMVLTVHRWFANKSCPGDWLYSRLGDVAAKVTSRLGGTTTTTTAKAESKTVYRVQTGAFKNKANAEELLKNVRAAGFSAFLTQSGNTYKVQIGAFTSKANAEKQRTQVTAKGFTAVVVSDTAAVSPYSVTVTVNVLNVRKEPSINSAITGTVFRGNYEIVAESEGEGAAKWGKLESGAGWISLDFTKKI